MMGNKTFNVQNMKQFQSMQNKHFQSQCISTFQASTQILYLILFFVDKWGGWASYESKLNLNESQKLTNIWICKFQNAV